MIETFWSRFAVNGLTWKGTTGIFPNPGRPLPPYGNEKLVRRRENFKRGRKREVCSLPICPLATTWAKNCSNYFFFKFLFKIKWSDYFLCNQIYSPLNTTSLRSYLLFAYKIHSRVYLQLNTNLSIDIKIITIYINE